MSASFSSDSPDAKKPCKGILKTSSSFDKHHNPAHRKSAKFDELNVLQTYHPPDKDYGHMKIDEPKTPYNYQDPALNDFDQLDAGTLTEKLKVAADSTSADGEEDGARARNFYSEEEEAGDSEEDAEEKVPETDEQKVHRQDFEKRRKQHYKEFDAVKMARKLIEEEDEEEGDDDDDDDLDSSKIIVVESSEVVLPPPLPGTLSMDTSPTEGEAAASTVTGQGSSV